jgi:negative regulator of sigma-B (phosphoserine phosphatase)
MALTETSVQLGGLLIETAAMTKEGEDVSGDCACIGQSEAGVLVGVVDGLGHGAEAGEAAHRAGVVLEDPATGMQVTDALRRCHTALRGTRGAVIALAAFPAQAADMEWLAVGNIEGVLVRGRWGRPGREMIVQRPGIVGHHMPPLRSSTLPVRVGDTLVFATDGVRREVAQAVSRRGTARLPGGVAELLEEFATGTDDALLLTARYGVPA